MARKGRPIPRKSPGGLDPFTPEAVLAVRLDMAHWSLTTHGFVNEAFAIKLAFKKRRWRMLVEYLEAMHLKGLDEEMIEFVREWRPDINERWQDLGVLD